MNQDRVKALLLEIEESELEFSVTFTGKASKKVNGLYKPDTHEIILHNKNFSTDNELLYTAIHEYTHHRLCEKDGGVHSSRVHTQRFWSSFHALLKKAEDKGLYKIALEESPELLELTETIRTTIMTEDGKLMKELGRLLGKARTLCKTAGVRYEDYIDRVLCLPRASASTIEKMHTFDVKPDLGYEAMKVVANIPNADKRKAAENLFLSKNSPAFVRDTIKKKQPEEDARQKLEKEQHRLEKTIMLLQERLEKVKSTLAHIPVILVLFGLSFYTMPCVFAYTENMQNGSMQVPPVPAIPDITIREHSLHSIEPPVISPPVMQRIDGIPQQQMQPIQKLQNEQLPKKEKKVSALNGLTARTLSALTQNTDNFLLFNKLLGETNGIQETPTEVLLTKILDELEKLQQKMSERSEPKNEKTDGAGKIVQPDTGSTAYEKKPSVELIRLRINNRELKDSFTHTFCSSAMEEGHFLYGADRRFIANGITLDETIYMFGKENAEGAYDIAFQLCQHPTNTQSFLYKLYQLSPIRVTKTSDLLFWHYKTGNAEIELIFRLFVRRV